MVVLDRTGLVEYGIDSEPAPKISNQNFTGQPIQKEIRNECENMSNHCSGRKNSATANHIVFLELGG